MSRETVEPRHAVGIPPVMYFSKPASHTDPKNLYIFKRLTCSVSSQHTDERADHFPTELSSFASDRWELNANVHTSPQPTSYLAFSTHLLKNSVWVCASKRQNPKL